MKSFHDEALVMGKKPVKEKDELVILLTKERGKMAFMSYGSRDPKSRKAGVLELFNTIAFEARQGKQPLPVLHQVKALKLRAFSVVHEQHQDLRLFYRASEMLRFVSKYLYDDQNVQNVYFDLNTALDWIQEPVVDLLFRVKFLDDMGLLSDCSRCSRCGEVFKESDSILFEKNSTGFAHSHCCQGASDSSIALVSVDSSTVKLMKFYQATSLEEGLKVAVDPQRLRDMLGMLEGVEEYQ